MEETTEDQSRWIQGWYFWEAGLEKGCREEQMWYSSQWPMHASPPYPWTDKWAQGRESPFRMIKCSHALKEAGRMPLRERIKYKMNKICLYQGRTGYFCWFNEFVQDWKTVCRLSCQQTHRVSTWGHGQIIRYLETTDNYFWLWQQWGLPLKAKQSRQLTY